MTQERAERFLALRDLVQHARELGQGNGDGATDRGAGRRAQLAQLRRAAEFVVLPLSKAHAPSSRRQEGEGEQPSHEACAEGEEAGAQERSGCQEEGRRAPARQRKRRREQPVRSANTLSAAVLQEAKAQLKGQGQGQKRQRRRGKRGECEEEEGAVRGSAAVCTPQRPQGRDSGGTREVLLRSLAFRRYRICIDDDSTDSPCASPGAFGTPTQT